MSRSRGLARPSDDDWRTRMHYMFLIYNCDDRPKPGDPRFEEILTRVNAFADECRRRGGFVAGDPLKPGSTATTVRGQAGKAMLTDGPVAETHQPLGRDRLPHRRDPPHAPGAAPVVPPAPVGAR